MTSKAKQTKVQKLTEETEVTAVAIQKQTDADFKNSLLIVSLAVNVTLLIAWVALKVTSSFDYQVASLLFYR